ncbi:MAG: phosphotransferase family protein, partial [Sphingobacteriia bacterium]
MAVSEQLLALHEKDPLSFAAVAAYLGQAFSAWGALKKIERFPGGYSNLTYLVQCEKKQVVLRRPPAGATIQTAHDMGRESRVLQALAPHFSPLPQVYVAEDDPHVLGAPFFLMEHLAGLVLRAGNAPGMNWPPERYAALSKTMVQTLARLHAIDLTATGLLSLGKPTGYVARQVKGWTDRYLAAATDKIGSLDHVADWLNKNQPPAPAPAFLHNDFKYDNLILDPAQ